MVHNDTKEHDHAACGQERAHPSPITHLARAHTNLISDVHEGHFGLYIILCDQVIQLIKCLLMLWTDSDMQQADIWGFY